MIYVLSSLGIIMKLVSSKNNAVYIIILCLTMSSLVYVYVYAGDSRDISYGSLLLSSPKQKEQ